MIWGGLKNHKKFIFKSGFMRVMNGATSYWNAKDGQTTRGPNCFSLHVI